MGKYYAQTNSLCYKAALPIMVRQKLYTPSCKKRLLYRKNAKKVKKKRKLFLKLLKVLLISKPLNS